MTIPDNGAMATSKKPKGLGLGLEALLGPRVKEAGDAPAMDDTPHALPVDRLLPGRYQPRTRLEEGALLELAASIRSQGVMQPILVRPVAGGRYEVIAGERRWRAAKLAGLAEIPVLVREVPDEAAAVMALVENIQREDLNPLEEAQGLKRLTDEFGLSHEQAATAVGRSRSAASNLLRLLNLADPVQQLLLAGDLDMGHARALLALPGALQVGAAQQVVARRLSVREAEKLVTRQLAPKGRQATLLRVKKAGPSADIARLERLLADALAAPVSIRIKKRTKRGDQGEVAIGFASPGDLAGILQRLGIEDT